MSLASTVSAKPGRNTDTRAVSPPKNYTTTVPLKDAAVHRAGTGTKEGVDQPQHRGANGQSQHPKPSASASQLPSTIPDSLAARMAAMASQSDGDTQPLSQGVREELASKIRAHHAERQSAATSENTSNWVSRSHSLQPGETGYVNILEGFDQSIEGDTQEAAEIQDDDIDLNSQGVDVRVELFPESRRFQHPTTPATTSRKRQRVGSSISRENTTPRLPINPFAGQPGGLDGMMNASQAFKATQFTSPLPNALPSDGLSERPSPDILNIQRPSTADPVSSPVRLPRSRMTRAVTEPQTTYISMEESQAERERLKTLKEMALARVEQTDSDDDFDSEDSELRRRRIRRKIDMESRDVFATVTAKARPGPARRGRGGRRQQTPRTASRRRYKTSESDAVIISDSPVAEGNVTEDETEKEQENADESDADSPDELSEENKENFALKDLRISMTTARVNLRRTPGNAMQATPPRHHVRRSVSPEVASANHQGLREGPSIASIDPAEEAPTGTATIAIADSQPMPPTGNVSSSKGSQARYQVSASSPEQRLFVPQSQLSRSPRDILSGAGVLTAPPDEPICVPASSTSPTIQHVDDGLQPRQPNLRPSGSEESSNDVAGPSQSTGIPTLSNDIRSSPPQIGSTMREAASGQSLEKLPSGTAVTGRLPHSTVLSVNFPQSTHKDRALREESPQPQKQERAISSILDTSSAELRNGNHEPIPASSAPPASTNTSTRLESRIPSSQANGAASGPSTLYETAPSHKTVSPNLSNAVNMRQSLRKPISTPNPKQARPKTMIEIATAASPPDATNGLDMDINLMTAEDMEYQAVMNGSSPIGPARKRRRGRMGRVLHMEGPESDEQPTPAAPMSGVRQGDGEAVNSVDPAKDQLDVGHLPITSENPKTLPSVRSIPKAALSAETPRKRGRPKKTTSSAKTPAESRPSELRDRHSSRRTPRLELPRIQTGTEPQGADEGSLASALVVAPNQVFAHFNGTYTAAFYPATCIGLVDGEVPRYRVRFDDGTVDVINGFGIKKLELKTGDNVKLDCGGSRRKNYVVVKMQDRQQPMLTPDPETPTRRNLPGQASAIIPTQTDIRGYASVVVAPKQASSTKQQPDELLTVPVRDVYFTQTMWTSLKDRTYTYTPVRSHLSSRIETPLERSSIPSTPSSRVHRAMTSGFGPSRSNKPPTTARSNLFENMIFAITNIGDSTLRTALNNLINNHGGQLLSEDFSELFHIPSLGPFSPSKRSPKRDTEQLFHLTTAASRKGFTCLIADKHCRMAKYIQALALGIPCLSSRWVQDCAAQKVIIPWEPYLLAAGESSFLNGAVRSRILPSIDPLSTTLSDIIEARPKPLENATVLLIMEKSEEETMRSHPLLSHALGARKVSRATSLDAAAKVLAEAKVSGERWDWVYSHEKEDKARKMLLGRDRGSSSGMGKKRKRGSSAMSWGQDSEGAQTRVVGNEFVIQSLILGRLIDTN